MRLFNYKDYTIELINDSNFTVGSNDNVRTYKNEYSEGFEYSFSSQHGVIVRDETEELYSAIIKCDGGHTGIHDKCSIIKNGAIIICCGDSVCSLNLLDLNLNWLKKVDMATCFCVYEMEDDLIIHGEIEISRITQQGEIVWQFRGRDIFVTIEGLNSCEIVGDEIRLTDFLNNGHVLDKNGHELKQ